MHVQSPQYPRATILPNKAPLFGCRLFAYLSPKPSEEQDQFIRECLLTGGNSMKRQNQLPFASTGKPDIAADPHYASETDEMRRGWGLAWFKANQRKPKIHKSPVPAYRDAEYDRQAQAAAKAQPAALLAHLRDHPRSGGKGECHPFHYGDWALMHHGDLSASLMAGMSKELDRLAQQGIAVPGPISQKESDSQLLSRFIATRLLQKTGSLNTSHLPAQQLETAFKAIVKELTQWPASHSLAMDKRLYPQNAHISHPGSLNLVFTDGKHLIATRNASGCPLYMGKREQSPEIVFATDPIQPTPASGLKKIQWQPLQNGQTVLAEISQDQKTTQPILQVQSNSTQSAGKFRQFYQRAKQTLQQLFQNVRQALTRFFNWLVSPFRPKQD